MDEYKTAKTEAGRLQALHKYDILDSKEDPNFNDFVALAATVCDVPMAAINFVDTNRTWTKASFGIEVQDVPRADSFCAYTILQNDAMVINDTHQDSRFKNNDLVAGKSKIRFYAGSPIVNSAGYAIGTICVMGLEPRHLTPGQRLSLRAISRQVITQLELRHRFHREDYLKKNLILNKELEFKTVFGNLPHGVAKIGLNGRFIDSNSAFLDLIGFTKEELCHLTEYDVTHTDDLNPLNDIAVNLSDPSSKHSRFQKRYIAKDGSITWVQVSGVLVTGDEDHETSVIMAVEDINPVKALEAQALKTLETLERAKIFASNKLKSMEDLIENMNEGVLVQDSSARIVQLNRAAMQILGLSEDELSDQSSLDLHKNALKTDGQPLTAEEHPMVVALKTGKPQIQFPIIVNKNDEKSHVTISAVPLFHDGQEKPHSVVCTVSNLTQLQAKKIELENTLKAIPAGLYRTDKNGHCTFVNEKWCELSGLTHDEALKLGWMANIHPEDKERVTVEWNASVGEGFQFETIYRLLRADGNVFHVQAAAAKVSDVDVKGGGYLWSVQDITSLREAEVLNAFYKTSLDTAAIVAFTDAKGNITYANNMYCELSGYSREELFGSKHKMLDSGLSGKFPTKASWESTNGPTKWHGEIRGISKSGKEYWVATTVVPVFGAEGKAERFMSLGRDVTLQKRQQQELAEAYKKAEKATNAKSDFLSTMSHEIRTPLNGVIGMTSLLQETSLTPEQLECVEAISSSGTILLSIINDILDFSKIEAGVVDIEVSEFDLEKHIKEIIKPLHYPAQKKGIQLVYESSGYKNYVFGDDGKIGQVITNLVSNAIKFTNKGSVTITSRLEAKDKDTLMILEVTDTGIGIPATAMGQMFQPFSQAEKSTNRNYGGTGLGLSISKRLIELMKGRIALKSKINKGTTFKVELTLKTGHIIEKKSTDENQKIDLGLASKKRPTLLGRILVAEDNTTNQKVIARMLDKWKCKYNIVANGSEALDMLRDTHFDLILMDCQMPEMDGYTATRLIRQSDLLSKQVPIVALTANAISGDETLCVQSGMDGYLTKPVDMKDLETILLKYLEVDNSEKDITASAS